MMDSAPVFKIEDIIRATGGALVRGAAGVSFRGITTDSRVISKGNLFVALHGERFDGHAFLDQAVAQGAGGLLVHRDDGTDRGDIPTILVKDTLTSLGDVAHDWRKRFSVPVIAITGSSGKTTTKEMAAAILSQGRDVLKTQGNYNNLIGLPLALFRLHEGHDVVILELGTNHPGEIARLSEIAAPDIAVVTNVGPAHLEGFGSLEGVGREKGDLFRYMPSGGTIVINMDDDYVRTFETGKSRRRITFGFHPEADLSARGVRYAESGGIRFTLNMKESQCDISLAATGRHNVANALAAASLAWAAGSTLEEIRHGLETFRPVSGRMETIALRNGAFLLDDTYNANPASVGEALKTLQALRGRGRGIAILGDMLELGGEAEAWHRNIGGLLADTGVALVYLRGSLSRATAAGALSKGMAQGQILHFTDASEIVGALGSWISPGDWILVKGSRGMKMEEVVERLTAAMGRKGDASRLKGEAA
jgi:UDP-N-acetylmuramoyl-tripeptide--D-alanyl-D-alanine ligase